MVRLKVDVLAIPLSQYCLEVFQFLHGTIKGAMGTDATDSGTNVQSFNSYMVRLKDW